jgi:chromosome segregation ATPase
MEALRGEIGSVSRDNEAKLQADLKKAADKLGKLWDAYEMQERDVVKLKERISFIEQELLQKDNIIATLKATMEARDNRLREQDIELTAAKRSLDAAEPKIRSLESQLRGAENRYSNVLKLWQASYESARFWKKAHEDQNEWFESHLGLVGNLSRALEERQDMLNLVRREAAKLDIQEEARRKALKESETPKVP